MLKKALPLSPSWCCFRHCPQIELSSPPLFLFPLPSWSSSIDVGTDFLTSRSIGIHPLSLPFVRRSPLLILLLFSCISLYPVAPRHSPSRLPFVVTRRFFPLPPFLIPFLLSVFIFISLGLDFHEAFFFFLSLFYFLCSYLHLPEMPDAYIFSFLVFTSLLFSSASKTSEKNRFLTPKKDWWIVVIECAFSFSKPLIFCLFFK